VAFTDYEGLGTPGDHTYLVQRSEGHAVLDMARAALRLPATGLSPDAPVALWGYSQGGGAVVAASEQAATYAPELRTVGVAAGGVPADLAAVFGKVDGTSGFGLAVAATVGMAAAYPDLGLPGSLAPEGRAMFEFARNACGPELLDRRLSGHRSADLFGPTVPAPLLTRLRENSLGAVPPSVPVLLYQGQRDEFIPPSSAVKLAGGYCARGARVRFELFRDADHGTAAQRAYRGTLGWLEDRFAGRPVAGTCAPVPAAR